MSVPYTLPYTLDCFDTMVLDNDKLEGFDFVRLYEMLSIIVVSCRVAKILVDANLSGVRIMKPSEWKPGII